MYLNPKGKVAIITGASGGIGSAIAWVFAEERVNLVLAHYKHDCKELVKMIKGRYKVKIMDTKTDVSQFDQDKELTNTTLDNFGRIDILINNAGISCKGPVDKISENDSDQATKVNLKSAFMLSKLVMESMKKRKCGRIINIGSLAAKTAGNAKPWR